MRRSRLVVALAAVLTVAAPGCRLETEQIPASAEAVAPDFALPAHDGEMVGLSDLTARGPAILVFYRGHW